MKKIVIFIFLIFSALQAKDETKIMQFSHFMDGEIFAFKLNAIRKIPCKMVNLDFLSFNNTACFNSKKELIYLKKEYKKAVEAILKPGKKYYVTAKTKTPKYYICDVNDKKQNFRLKFVKSGLAKPATTDDEILNLAHKDAKENKLGIYSDKFNLITECIFEKSN